MLKAIKSIAQYSHRRREVQDFWKRNFFMFFVGIAQVTLSIFADKVLTVPSISINYLVNIVEFFIKLEFPDSHFRRIFEWLKKHLQSRPFSINKFLKKVVIFRFTLSKFYVLSAKRTVRMTKRLHFIFKKYEEKLLYDLRLQVQKPKY